MERVASAIRSQGHEVRILDLQIFTGADFVGELSRFRPDAIGFSGNYLANVPEIVELAKQARAMLPESTIFVGGHSASFIADEILAHGDGAIDCVMRGEGEAGVRLLMDAIEGGGIDKVPGATTLHGNGPAPIMLDDLDKYPPARDLG